MFFYFLFVFFKANQLLKPVAGCQLSFSIGTHKAMRKVIPLLPENIIISNDTIVPGVEDKPGEDTAGELLSAV